MRDTTHPAPSEMREGRTDAFALAVIVCAAALVAVFSLHGGPNLFGDSFDPGALLARAH